MKTRLELAKEVILAATPLLRETEEDCVTVQVNRKMWEAIGIASEELEFITPSFPTRRGRRHQMNKPVVTSPPASAPTSPWEPASSFAAWRPRT